MILAESTTMIDRIQRDEIELYRTRVGMDGSAEAEAAFIDMLNAMQRGTEFEFRVSRAWLDFLIPTNIAVNSPLE